jgi:hypothetical protein
LRYERAFARASETDSVTFETFMANEQREMNNDQTPTLPMAAKENVLFTIGIQIRSQHCPPLLCVLWRKWVLRALGHWCLKTMTPTNRTWGHATRTWLRGLLCFALLCLIDGRRSALVHLDLQI